MIMRGNPNTTRQELDEISSGVPLYGMYMYPTMNDINAPRVILNSEITPNGPEMLTGDISEINIGQITENAPAAKP